MKRDIEKLAHTSYDLIVVGGGIFGICTAWDAVLRGLSVALVESADFGGATSAGCFKMVHGGMRYLQHADLARLRESAWERSVLLRVAPHLVQPLPIVVPTYGYGKNGRAFLAAGLFIYDLLTCDRNFRINDPDRKIPLTRLMNKDEVLRHFPGVHRKGLTGGVLFYDGQMYSPQRLALAFLMSAVEAGADVANYVKAETILSSSGRVVGVGARDVLTNRQFEMRGQVVVNAAGPWSEQVLRSGHGIALQRPCTFSRDAYFVASRSVHPDLSLAVQARTKDPDALLSRPARHLFLVPWRNRTIVGVWHVVHDGDADKFTVTDDDLNGFVEEINWAYPSLNVSPKEISKWDAGLVLFGENDPEATDLSYGKRSRVIDHATEHGLEGLLTLIGIRYTTARVDAERLVARVFQKMGRKAPPSKTDTVRVYGGNIDRMDDLMEQVVQRWGTQLGSDVATELVRHHGVKYEHITNYLTEHPQWARRIGGLPVIEAEVVHAVRDEMAQRLGDVVFRRTAIGATGDPGIDAVTTCAEIMARETGWDASQMRAEIRAVAAIIAEHCPAAPGSTSAATA